MRASTLEGYDLILSEEEKQIRNYGMKGCEILRALKGKLTDKGVRWKWFGILDDWFDEVLGLSKDGNGDGKL
jgi:hypothetical protein